MCKLISLFTTRFEWEKKLDLLYYNKTVHCTEQICM